jgi:outer membrane protein
MKHLLLCLAAALPAAAQDTVPARPLTLAEAVSLARATSPDRARLQALAEASAAGLDAARAQRMPSLELSGSYTRHQHVPVAVLPIPGVGPQVLFPDLPNAWRSRAAVSAPLYTGGRVGGGIEAGEAALQASQAETSAAEADLVLETVAAYWSLVDARDAERVLADALKSYDAHLADARNREAVGLSARNEVLAVLVERERGELSRLQAANRADVAEANLARLTGLPGRLEPTEPPAAGAAAPAGPELATLAIEARPELLALRARLEAARAQARVQRAGRRPQASATAAYDFSNPNFRIMPPRDEFKGTWSVGVGFTWTPWDGGRTSALAAQAEAQARAVEKQLQDAEQRVRLEVTSRALELDAARAALEVAGRAVESARENVQVAADRYREGVAPSSELLDAETGLLEAGLERTRAATQLQLSRAALDRAVGRAPGGER